MLSWWKWSYLKISSDGSNDGYSNGEEEMAPQKLDRLPNSGTFSHYIKAIISVVVCVGGLVMLILGIVHGRSSTRSKHEDGGLAHLCGNSSAEALSLGCSWDQLTWSWLPPDCPHYANEEFLKADNWKFYTDPLGKQEAVGDIWTRALDNEVDLWGERREHLTHCVYLFLSLGQIIRDRTPYHPRLTAYDHIQHCSKIILEALQQDEAWYKMETSTGRVSYEEHCSA